MFTYLFTFQDVDYIQHNNEYLLKAFKDCLIECGYNIVSGITETFDVKKTPEALFLEDKAITSVFILSESHAVLHTFPESGVLTVDIFECNTKLVKSELFLKIFSKAIGADHYQEDIVDRI
ncbi:MAG: S-adenosylmethionine decarboxylase [Ignavibacteriaceae bacterium]|nr:S-adenosylmethionine decarboxylase [Ignavibacteriaceae bacterium]